MVAARVLSKDDFGALGALLGILIIVSTLSIALQAQTARRVTTASAAERPVVEGQAIRLSLVIGGILAAVGLLAAWPLGLLFAIPYPAVAMGLVSLGFVVFGTATLGIAQGREEHTKFAAGFIANGVGRAMFGIIAVLLIPTVTGASLGILIGVAAGALVSYLLVCRGTWGRSVGAGAGVDFFHVAHALVVLYLLTNIDVLIARIFLTEELSGEYSVGVLLAKIAFFLPNAIILVLFPKMAAGNARRAVFIAAGLTAMVGVAITGFSLFFGTFVIRVLGGPQYAQDLGSEAWLFALEGSAFALVQVLLYARLAAQDRRAVAMVWIALVALVAIVVGWRHDSVVEIVTSVVLVSLVLTAVGLFLDWRSSSKEPPNGVSPLPPIEAAE
jgi:O-antigen/teichoic acid export membrane protein